MAKSALPLIAIAGVAALAMKKKKKKPGTKTPDRATLPDIEVDDEKVEPAPAPTPTPAPAPKPIPGPVPSDQVEPGVIAYSGSTSTKNYGQISWRVRVYAQGPQFYVEMWDPDDGEFENMSTNGMEGGPIQLFNSVDEAKKWTNAFIINADSEGHGNDGMVPGGYYNLHIHSRYGLVLPYRTPKTTISIRRKSGMVWYPAKVEEARFFGWDSNLPEQALVDINVKGEYSVIALDGGPNGVFIAEWLLGVTQG